MTIKPIEQDKPLDKIDRRILRELQADGRLSNTALSRLINLSPTPCAERVKSLERRGLIAGYTARLNPHLLGLESLILPCLGSSISAQRPAPSASSRWSGEALLLAIRHA